MVILKMSNMRNTGGVLMICDRYSSLEKALFISPPSLFFRPHSTSKKVVLPEPFGPRRPDMEPAVTVREAL